MPQETNKKEKAPKLRRAGRIALVSTVITIFGAIFLTLVSIFVRRKKRKD